MKEKKGNLDPENPAHWGCFGISMLLVLWLMFGRDGGSSSSGASEDWRYRQDARAAVRARLKSPSTASFSGERFSRQSGEMVVVGMVESQNGFGAMVRSGFRVTFRGKSVTGVEILER